jgi:hypothetical protein
MGRVSTASRLSLSLLVQPILALASCLQPVAAYGRDGLPRHPAMPDCVQHIWVI